MEAFGPSQMHYIWCPVLHCSVHDRHIEANTSGLSPGSLITCVKFSVFQRNSDNGAALFTEQLLCARTMLSALR